MMVPPVPLPKITNLFTTPSLPYSLELTILPVKCDWFGRKQIKHCLIRFQEGEPQTIPDSGIDEG
jgi:hypothetical protein